MSDTIYASMDSESICNSITIYHTPFDSPPSHYMKIDSHDISLLGKRWNGSSFETVEE